MHERSFSLLSISLYQLEPRIWSHMRGDKEKELTVHTVHTYFVQGLMKHQQNTWLYY